MTQRRSERSKLRLGKPATLPVPEGAAGCLDSRQHHVTFSHRLKAIQPMSRPNPSSSPATIRSPQTVCREILQAIPEKTRRKTVTKSIRFSNDDVPAFLGQLNRFEAQSAKKDYALR